MGAIDEGPGQVGGLELAATADRRPTAKRAWVLFLSAETAPALELATANLAAFAEAHPKASAADAASVSQVGRRAHAHRRALVCRDLADAARVLAGDDPGRLLSNEVTGVRPVAFLLPGLGEQYPDMGLGLYQTEPRFRATIDRCAAILEPLLGSDLRQAIYPHGTDSVRPAGSTSESRSGSLDLARMLGRAPAPADPGERRLHRTQWAHPAIFAIEYALAQLWRSMGVEPEVMVGYSLGEYVAACVADVFSLEDALRLVALRARAIERLPAGAMVAVPMAEAEAARFARDAGLALSAVNGPSLSILAGTLESVEHAAGELAARDVACQRIRSQHAFHTAAMHEVRDTTLALLRGAILRAPRIPFLSCLTGDWISPSQATDPEYWARQMCEPVQLARGLDRLWADPSRILVEIGPGQTLCSLALQHPGSVGAADPVALSSLPAAFDRQPETERFSLAIAKLWLAGGAIDPMAGEREAG
jgi:acyl transferase domain-containing protein